MLCEAAILRNEVSNRTFTGFISYEHIYRNLSRGFSIETSLIHVPRWRADGLDLYLSHIRGQTRATNQKVITFRIPIRELGVVPAPQKLAHYEVLARVSCRNARTPLFIRIIYLHEHTYAALNWLSVLIIGSALIEFCPLLATRTTKSRSNECDNLGTILCPSIGTQRAFSVHVRSGNTPRSSHVARFLVRPLSNEYKDLGPE